MIVLNAFRMLTDLSFFLSLFGIVSAFFGGHALILPILALSLIFGLCAGLQNHGRLRYLPLFLTPALLFFPDLEIWDRIGITAGILYLIVSVIRQDQTLSWYRQADIFSLYLKLYIPAFLLGCVCGDAPQLLKVSAPPALLTLLADVFLLRSLRHEPKVYLSARHQLQNGVVLLGATAVSALLSTKAAVNGALFLLKTFYFSVIVPILGLFFAALGYLAAGLIWLLKRLSLLNPDRAEEILSQMQNAPAQTLTDEIEVTAAGNSELAVRTAQGIGIALLAAAVLLLFLWLWHKKEKAESDGGTDLSVSKVRPLPSPSAPMLRGNSPAVRVRREYRKYLKYCLLNDIPIDRDDTSRDILQRSAPAVADEPSAAALRGLYLKARYSGEAVTKADAALAAKLSRQIRKKQS